MNSSTPIVSVIIATYNCGQYIIDALWSVQAQTMKQWECIIIDDGSTDNTARIVPKLIGGDPRFTYVQLPMNGGVSAARNHGLQRARGEFIQLLDADDVIALNKLQVHVDAMRSDPDLGVVYSDFYHFTNPTEIVRVGEYQADEKLNGAGDHIMSRLIRSNVFRLNTVLFRKALLGKVRGFQNELRHVEDLDLWFRIAAKGTSFRFLDQPDCLSGVRISPGGLSKDRTRMRSSHLLVLQSMWHQRGLSFLNRAQILLRYVDAALEAMIIRRERVSLLSESKSSFLVIVIPLALVLLPLWLLSRPLRSS